tara:strand:- start:1789 stop:2088 length:300 start_codon:yes stop_codon:yes gene_type:complete
MNVNQNLIDIIDTFHQKLDIIKQNINKSNNLRQGDIIDIIEILEQFNSKYLDDIIYKIDSNLHITDRTNRERIDEYELHQKILRPFLPTILMYSMLLNH